MKIVTNSESRTWRRCRRKWWLTYFRRLKFTRPESHGARGLGNLVHGGLERYYSCGLDPQAAYTFIAEARLYAIDAINQWHAAHESDPTEDLKYLDGDCDLAIIMLQGYFDWLEESAADANLEVVATEEEIIVPFIEDSPIGPVQLGGKLDKRGRKVDTGFTFFLDFKTVGNLTDWPKIAAMNEQGLTYSVLLRLKYPDAIVDGEIVRMLRKVKRTASAKPPFFGDHEVRWSRDQLNNYVARLHGIIHDIVTAEVWLAAGADPQVVCYPNPTRDCSWDCDFYPVCGMFDDGSRVEDALTMHYHEADPNARYTFNSTNGANA